MKVCLVTSDLAGFINNGGVGTANAHLAGLLSQNYTVDILFTGLLLEPSFEFKTLINEYKNKGIRVLGFRKKILNIEHSHYYAYLSYLVFNELKDSNYKTIIFPDMHGLGYYCMMAKKNHTHFLQTSLKVMFHGPTEWHLKNNIGLPTTFSELSTFFIEKKSCLEADLVIFSTDHALKLAIETGYFNKNHKYIKLLFPFNFSLQNQKRITSGKINELCFFGRLESRKGVEVFLNSLKIIKERNYSQELKVTFIGIEGYVQSRLARAYISEWSQNNSIAIKMITNFDSQKALEYLKHKNRLAILPSIEETMGYTLIECLVSNIPFICSDIPPYLEIISFFNPQSFNVFKSNNADSLSQKVLEVLELQPALPAIQNNFKDFSQQWVTAVMSDEPNQGSNTLNKAILKLSVGIVFFDRPVYLKQLLNSLLPLMSFFEEIVIYNNKSELSESKVFLEEIKNYDKVKVIGNSDNLRPGHVRNLIASEIKSENILFIDDDNLVIYESLKKLLTNLGNDWDVVVAPLVKFNNKKMLLVAEAISPEKLAFLIKNEVTTYWVPIGQDITINIFDNLIGDCNLLVKKDMLLKIGGFNTEMVYGEDQEFLIRGAVANFRYRISPDPFIYYRIHETNLLKNIDINMATSNLLNHVLENESLRHVGNLFYLMKAWSHEKNRYSHFSQLQALRYAANKAARESSLNPESLDKLVSFIDNSIYLDEKKDFLIIDLFNEVSNEQLIFEEDVDDQTSVIFTFYAPSETYAFFGAQEFFIPEGSSRLELFVNSKQRKSFWGKNGKSSIYLRQVDFSID